MSTALILIGIVLLIACSAFFSASEMAYSSCNSLRLENLRDEGSRRAAIAVKILNHFDDALSAILIGNNLVNIGASSLMAVLVILMTGGDGKTWIGTLILTIAIIIFGESIPKICAKKGANRMALRFAYAVRFLMLLLYPVVWLVVKLIALLTFWMKTPEDADSSDEAVEELHSIIETAEDEDVLDEDQSELVRSAIDFSEISALEVMTARVDVCAIDIEDDWDEILATVEQAPFSRIPVYEGSIDNIIGILYLNHFLKAMADGGRADIRGLLMPPCYIYKTMKLPAVLSQLRKAKQHLAVVTDEYGGTLGVVSMEDVLEQIVGDIWDDTDTVEQEVVRRTEGEWELDGSMMLYELEELLGLDEGEIEAESSTVGGWTIESFGGFPNEGESFTWENLTVTVLEMTDGRRVERVLVKVNDTKKAEE
ncbi:MAG: HlyC/CorC family transporter [Oscillospiraceae bacterium]|nr:HlyC/CorC family transporter [Oscillospiraceae bacterium]